ncbi:MULTISPECIES: hypothetical protein [unclassified Pseudomonas]|uniref:hypothetical protein n=1 Tax=unclassified Pseudomonas TaxID=196821 RepID=UPI000B82D486|nr:MULTISPECIES: hypothetical protein [unclassified Pseudomonas]
MALTASKLGRWLSNILIPFIAILSLVFSLYTCYTASSAFEQIDRKIDTMQSELQSLRNSPSSSPSSVTARLVRVEGAVEMLTSDTYQKNQFERQIVLFEQAIKDRQRIQLAQMHGGE